MDKIFLIYITPFVLVLLIISQVHLTVKRLLRYFSKHHESGFFIQHIYNCRIKNARAGAAHEKRKLLLLPRNFLNRLQYGKTEYAFLPKKKHTVNSYYLITWHFNI